MNTPERQLYKIDTSNKEGAKFFFIENFNEIAEEKYYLAGHHPNEMEDIKNKKFDKGIWIRTDDRDYSLGWADKNELILYRIGDWELPDNKEVCIPDDFDNEEFKGDEVISRLNNKEIRLTGIDLYSHFNVRAKEYKRQEIIDLDNKGIKLIEA